MRLGHRSRGRAAAAHQDRQFRHPGRAASRRARVGRGVDRLDRRFGQALLEPADHAEHQHAELRLPPQRDVGGGLRPCVQPIGRGLPDTRGAARPADVLPLALHGVRSPRDRDHDRHLPRLHRCRWPVAARGLDLSQRRVARVQRVRIPARHRLLLPQHHARCVGQHHRQWHHRRTQHRRDQRLPAPGRDPVAGSARPAQGRFGRGCDPLRRQVLGDAGRCVGLGPLVRAAGGRCARGGRRRLAPRGIQVQR